MASLFICPICALALTREANRYTCPAGHSFDLAREGYVNLLPPNRQHSKAPGDDKEMTAARTRFLEGGWYSPLRDALCSLVEQHAPPSPCWTQAAGRAGTRRPWPGPSLPGEAGRRGSTFPSPE